MMTDVDDDDDDDGFREKELDKSETSIMAAMMIIKCDDYKVYL